MNMKWKKIVQWVVIICVAVIPLAMAYNLFPEFRVWKMAGTGELFDSVTFYYDEARGTKMLDSRYNIRNVYLPSHAELSELRVELVNDRIEFIGENETIIAYHGKENICTFKENVEYIALFFDRKGEEIARTNIRFLKSANLATVYISTLSGSFEKVDDDKKYSEEGRFSLVSTDGRSLFSDVGMEISSRGNHTFEFDKKSYQFDLNKSCNLLDMGESETWILLCNTYDISNLRNKITYDMAVAMGMEGAPQSEFVDVYFNDIYHGTYLLVEKVEYGENRLDYADMEQKNMLLNGTNMNTQKTFSYEEGKRKGYLLPETPEDITGGYLIEHDYDMKYREEKSGFITDLGECFTLKNPRHASKQEVDYIAELFQEIENAVISEDGYNKDTGKHYSEYIDVKSWAQKYIIEELSKNEGGGCTSSYFYKLSDNYSTQVFGGPVWDYDKAWGRQEGIPASTNDLNLLTIHYAYTNWFYYLYQHEEFKEAVAEEYSKVVAPYVETEMLQNVDNYYVLLKDSLEMNFVRFEQMYEQQIQIKNISLKDYDKAVEDLKSYIIMRKKAVDALLCSETELCTVYFKEYDNDNRVSIITKMDRLQNLPEMWMHDKDKSIWIDEATGKPITAEMVIDKDVVAIVAKK